MVKFMLDAGHGYFTSGKGVPTMKEHDFNRAVSAHIDTLLKAYKDVETHIAHDPTGKVDVALKARTDKANALKVDAYISLHADAFGTKEAKGETVYIYTKAGASTLAFANVVNKHLKAETSIGNRGVKRADFHVLRETKMIALLIEFGFMTNPQDLALLKSDAYRKKCAQMVVNALVEQFKLVKKPVVVVKPVAPKPAVSKLRKVIVDGKQVGTFANTDKAVSEAIKSGAKKIEIVLV